MNFPVDDELNIDLLKKFCLEEEEKNKDKKSDTKDKSLKTFSDSLLQFGNLLTCDLILEHHGRKYVS